EAASGEAVARSLRAPGVTEHIDLGPDIGICKLRAPGTWVGKSLAELELSVDDPSFVALVVQRGEETLAAPRADERIHEGDVLAILVQESKLDELGLPLHSRRRR